MENSKVVVMFSGGLDSVMATHLLMSQGLSVIALHFVLPFYAGMGNGAGMVEEYARALGVTLRVEEEGEEFLEMVRSPRFGYGKNANPCVDCRIHRISKAWRIAEELGAVCLATGEVVGQRPMSQKMETMRRIEKIAGLKGKLLRPLSAKLLDPTDAEIAGIIDREKLLDIHGRSRAAQLAYAKQHGLSHSAPAGGCILTNLETGVRFADLAEHDPQFSLTDFKLLAYGRHFRLSQKFRVIISRDESENNAMEKIMASFCGKSFPAPSSGDKDIAVSSTSNIRQLYLRDATGPIAFGIGEPTEDELRFGAAAVVRFSKLRNAESAAVVIKGSDGIEHIVDVKAADDLLIDKYRVASWKS